MLPERVKWIFLFVLLCLLVYPITAHPSAAFSANVTSGDPLLYVGFTGPSSATSMTYISKIGSLGNGNDEFDHLEHAATDDTYLWIADTDNGRIVKRWAANLTYISEVACGVDEYPNGVATDGTYIWVTDWWNWKVVKRWASDLSFISEENGVGTAYEFWGPRQIATDGTYLWIADEGNNSVVKLLASDLSFVTSTNVADGVGDDFSGCEGVAVSGSYVYVADTDNFRIVKLLASDLSYVSKIGSHGAGNDQFDTPYGLATDGTFVWVADTFNHRLVKRLASDLSYCAKIGSFGSGDDQFDYPYDVVVDSTGTYLWNTDNELHRIVKRYAGGEISSWYWDLGDGNTSAVQNPVHAYNSGLYTVKLKTTDCAQYTWENKTDYINVSGLPEVDFSANVTSGAPPLWVGFTDISTGNVTSWYWEFGDGNTSNSQNPTNEYSSAGLYSVNHSAINVNGTAWENKTAYINVTACSTPVAAFSANVTSGVAPFWVGFTDSSTNVPTSWLWEFGDGNTSNLQNPTHEYSSIGMYSVNFSATNACGTDWENKTNYINSTASTTIWWDKDTYSIGENATVTYSINTSNWDANDNFYAIVSTVSDPTTTIQEEIITAQTGSFTVPLISGLYSIDCYNVTLYGYNVTSGIWIEAVEHANWSDRETQGTVVYDNKMWVLYGYDTTHTALNDTWYSTDGVVWTEANASCAWPARRTGETVVYDNKMWVIGGSDITGYKDVWYSTDGLDWIEATSNASFGRRSSFKSLVYDGKMWVMGGSNYDIPATWTNDVWYSTNGITWTEATPHAGWTDRRLFSAVVYDNKMWVIGGQYSGGYLNDTWYSTDGITWIEANASCAWRARYSGSSTFVNGMLLYGGHAAAPFFGPYNDTWYSTDGASWGYIKDAEWPARWLFSSVFYNNKLWVLGGDAEPTPAIQDNDVWYLDEPVINEFAHDDMCISEVNETIPKFPPHSVRFVLQDYFGAPLTDVWVYATPIETTLGSWSWLGGLFGMNITETNYVNTTMNGSTGLDGSIDFIMYPTIKYNITCVGGTYGINYQTAIYPQENEIYLHIPTLNAPNTSSSVTYTTINSTFTPDAVGGVPGLNQWLALGTLLLVGTMFSKKSVKVAAVIVPLFGLFFYYIDWLEMNTMGLSILVSLLALGILSYARKAETVIGSK